MTGLQIAGAVILTLVIAAPIGALVTAWWKDLGWRFATLSLLCIGAAGGLGALTSWMLNDGKWQ